jgi:hypothetical protein
MIIDQHSATSACVDAGKGLVGHLSAASHLMPPAAVPNHMPPAGDHWQLHQLVDQAHSRQAATAAKGHNQLAVPAW